MVCVVVVEGVLPGSWYSLCIRVYGCDSHGVGHREYRIEGSRPRLPWGDTASSLKEYGMDAQCPIFA